MAAGGATVAERVEDLRVTISPVRLAVALALIAAVAGALAVVQDPLVHELAHNFRHVSGITCH